MSSIFQFSLNLFLKSLIEEYSYDKLNEIVLPAEVRNLKEFARYRGNKQLWKGEQEMDKMSTYPPSTLTSYSYPH